MCIVHRYSCCTVTTCTSIPAQITVLLIRVNTQSSYFRTCRVYFLVLWVNSNSIACSPFQARKCVPAITQSLCITISSSFRDFACRLVARMEHSRVSRAPPDATFACLARPLWKARRNALSAAKACQVHQCQVLYVTMYCDGDYGSHVAYFGDGRGDFREMMANDHHDVTTSVSFTKRRASVNPVSALYR